MKQEILIGQTDYSVLVKIRDTDGAPATGLTESDIDIAYARVETDNDVTTADVTPAALSALTDAHTDWGFEEVSATDHPGLYRLDIADAVFASGAWSAVVTITGTGLDPADLEFVLVNFDPKAATLPANAINAAAIATDAIDADALAADAIAEINATVDTALTDIHLDHLLAATYDPASKPGAADALLNELVESDSGVARFTANALEQGPGGAGSDPMVVASGTIGATGNDTTHLHLDGLTQGDDELNDLLLVIYDDSAAEYHSRWITDWVLSTELATVATLPFTPEDSTDTYTILGIRRDVSPASGSITSSTFAAGSITASTFASDALTAAKIASDVGSEFATALLDLTDGVESGVTVRQCLRLCGAVLGGVLSGAATTTVTIKAVNNSGTTRVTATVDGSGNRSALTLNL